MTKFIKSKKFKSLVPKKLISRFVNTNFTSIQLYSFFSKPTPKQFSLLTIEEQEEIMKNRILAYLYENQDEYIKNYVLENIFLDVRVEGNASHYEEMNLEYSTELATINEVITVLIADGFI